jgi:hypothetical protein
MTSLGGGKMRQVKFKTLEKLSAAEVQMSVAGIITAEFNCLF